MFEKEEKELEKSRDFYNEIVFSDDFANAAILEGIQRAKREKLRGRKTRPVKILLVASILAISFITTVNVSETMADYMRNIPGMSQVIDFVRNDKGLMATVENDYIQKVDTSDKIGDIEITLDSVIYDEKNLILFYYFQAEDESQHVLPWFINLLNSNDELLTEKVYGQYRSLNENPLLELRVSLSDIKELPKDLILSGQFKVDGNLLEGHWSIPFQLDEGKFAKKQMFTLNKTVSVENQELTIKDVTVYPSQTDVHITFDPNNSKQLFGINDLQMVDEKGEVWELSSLPTTIINENELIFHLQSHYFLNPKELNLRFSSLRALDKDKLWVEIDPLNNQILEAPKDGKITEVKLFKDELFIKVETDLKFAQNMMFMHAIDQEGNVIEKDKSYAVSWSPTDNYIQYIVPYSAATASPGPIKLKILDYPMNIEKKVNVKIK
ncbi:DUF4179 domain-containing protein [Bacillus sp. JJ1503]|uniref:DUF4179 domain-containing protein n=1 Tax=unclassified Bacillus (in: firmicutes) TaxID=185979 RepID=UPI002FFE327F